MYSAKKIFSFCLIVNFVTNQVLCSVIPKPLDFENKHQGLLRAKRTVSNETTAELFENLGQILSGEPHLDPEYVIAIYQIGTYLLHICID